MTSTPRIRIPRSTPAHEFNQDKHDRAVALWGSVLSPAAARSLLDAIRAAAYGSVPRTEARRDDSAHEGPIVRKHRRNGFDRGADWARRQLLDSIYELLASTGHDPNASWAVHCRHDRTVYALVDLAADHYCGCSDCKEAK
jgi:hypothetical protein